jgi:hypothetical protein
LAVEGRELQKAKELIVLLGMQWHIKKQPPALGFDNFSAAMFATALLANRL